jgi:catechol 2,3-dioxygenase-like lactoylglutathione lyase family enzyme
MFKGDAQFLGAALAVNDLEKSATFYKAVCGLTEMGRLNAQLGGRDITEVLFNFRGEGPATFMLLKHATPFTPPTDEAMIFFTTEDIQAFFERAVEHGAEVVDAPLYRADYGVASALLRDLEGHLFGAIEQPRSLVGAN